MFSFALVALLSFICTCRAASQIALFSDSNCQDSYKGLEGPNGYPNGTCTDMRRSGPYGSFHVVGLDRGCTVTIYVDDAVDMCAGSQLEIGLVECYNATFSYYSFDFCDPEAAGETPSPSPSPSPSASSLPSSNGSSKNTGAIVGGVVGGVLGLGLILGIVFCWFRKRRQAAGAAQNFNPVHEIYTDDHHQELPTGAVIYKNANYNVAPQPPVELAGREWRGTDPRPLY